MLLAIFLIRCHYLELIFFAVALYHRVQNKAAREGQKAHEHQAHGQKRGGQLRHQARGGELRDHGHAGYQAQKHEDERHPGEQRQRLVVLEQRQDHHEHLHAVGDRMPFLSVCQVRSAMMNRGRRLVSRYIFPIYSPSTPMDSICIPPIKQTTAVVEVQPGTV